MRRLRCAAAVGGVVLSLSVAGCSSTPGDADPIGSSGSDLGLEHVHGLGMDPADGVLYAATHYGIWRIPDEGAATRVAERFQDTMGFTVVGPGTFLGSGHPDFRMDPDLPTRLGLIRSEDAGETWESLSLGGEADFHVLRVAHGKIYGWEAGAGRVMVSGDDGATWETRGAVDLRDLAVSPVEPDTMLATTGAGPLRSEDGGRTSVPVAGAPVLVVLAWASPDSLYGVGPDGAVLHSADGGITWLARGNVGGTPEALAVARHGGAEFLLVALSDTGILSSSDGGASFAFRYAE